MTTLPFNTVLVSATDAGGHPREFWYSSLASAQAFAARNSVGPRAWQDYEIWAKDPGTGKWEVVQTSPQPLIENTKL